MAAHIDVAKLRVSDRPHIARYLQTLVTTARTDSQRISITQQLDSAVASGSVPAHVYIIYMSVSKKHDFHPLVLGLRQSHTGAIRRAAVRELHRALRRGKSFGSAWTAVGGASGLSALMKEFSACDVGTICQQLGRTTGATDARTERQIAMTDLISTLQPTEASSMATDDTPQRDHRPLTSSYACIVPAATIEVIDEWENDGYVNYNKGIKTSLYKAYPQRYQRLFLDKIFSLDHKDATMRGGTYLFRSDLEFAEHILVVLADRDSKATHIPSDFMSEFIKPFLKRLIDSPKRKNTLLRVFKLIVTAFERHTYLPKSYINMNVDFPLQVAVKRYQCARDDSTTFWLDQISTLIALAPRAWPLDLYTVCSILEQVDLEKRYSLLRVLLKCHRTYRLDLDSMEDVFATRLQELKAEKHHAWPSPLFSRILDKDDALTLLQRLWAAYPGGDFLALDRWQGSCSMLNQTCKNSNRPDPETLNCFLIKHSQIFDKSEKSWLTHARSSIEQRRKKAEQTRDFSERGFWAKSAIMLCIAAGDLDTYKDLIVWARRFNKDSQASEMVYGASTLFTGEGMVLLSGFPVLIPETESLSGESIYQPIHSTAELHERVSSANDILATILETALLVAAQQSFKSHLRDYLLELPLKIMDRRARDLPTLRRSLSITDAELNDIVWKPTIELLLGFTHRARQIHVDRYVQDFPAKVAKFIRSLGQSINAAALADQIVFFMEKSKLEKSKMKDLSHDMMMMIQSLAESEQPALACSLVGTIVLGEEDNSSWYRQLLRPSFLASLPSSTARDFLVLIAESLKEKLQLQNERTGRVAAESRVDDDKVKVKDEALVKVATIKLFAQLLRDANFIDHESSCRLLTSLLPHTRHVDILVAVIQSLFATLNDRSTTAEMRVQIMDAIEQYAVPVAGRLDERRHMTNSDWINAEATKAPMPDVNQDHTIFDVLNTFACKETLLPHERARVIKWLFQALEQQASNNARWMALYMKKNDLPLDGLKEDFFQCAGPVNLDLLTTICQQHITSVPLSVFEMIKRVTRANLQPLPIICDLNKAVRESPEKNNSTAGKHWLAHFDTASEILQRGPYQCARTLCRVPRESEAELSTELVARLQDVVVESCGLLTHSNNVAALKDLLGQLADSWTEGRLGVWKLQVLPILKEVADGVDSLRTEEWQTSPSRSPVELLDTLWIRTRMIPIPHLHDITGTDSIPEELSTLIDHMCSRQEPYHHSFAELKNRLLYAPGGAPAVVALKIGGLVGVDLVNPTLSDHLRHELAYELLSTVTWDHPTWEDEFVLEMARSWADCRVEQWRPHGRDMIERMQNIDKL